MDIQDILEQPLAEMLAGKRTITGGNYAALFKLVLQNGFSDADFKKFLAARNVTLEKSEPESQGAFKMH